MPETPHQVLIFRLVSAITESNLQVQTPQQVYFIRPRLLTLKYRTKCQTYHPCKINIVIDLVFNTPSPKPKGTRYKLQELLNRLLAQGI